MRINHISSVTNQGKMCFMLYEGTFTAERFIKFLQQGVKAAHGCAMPRTKDELKNNVRQHLKKIARSPQRVRSCFQAKHIRYAA